MTGQNKREASGRPAGLLAARRRHCAPCPTARRIYGGGFSGNLDRESQRDLRVAGDRHFIGSEDHQSDKDVRNV